MYDVIVIGAGVMGGAAAYHLAGSGRQTLLLEQFTVGHTHGSSHGGSRIIRYTHREVDDARLMPAVFTLWRQLEAESNESLLKMTGGLYAGPEDESFMAGAQIALQTLRHPYRLMTVHELARELPQFRLPAGWLALYQQDSGVLAATRAVQTLARQAVRRGATLREQTQVQAVTPNGDGVAVRCAGPAGDETLYAHQAVITAGPWVQRLLQPLLPASLPLQVTHQQVAYFAVEEPERYAVGRCPIFLFTAEPHFYGFPIFERPNLIKVGQECLGNVVDPDAERVIDMAAMTRLSEVVAQTLVGVNPTPQQMELCLYTETPTREFIVDRHPAHPQILIGAGFSGRGFKFAIAIGRLLVDLAASSPGDYSSQFWLPKFALTRWLE
jgi:sarcosine oxidase